MATNDKPFGLDIPGYQIIEQLGIGAMAKVYLAVHDALERKVALKIMSESLLSDPEFKERFVREAKIVAQLSHPNIVAVYDVGVCGDLYYLAMQYHGGGDLKQKIKNGISIFDAITFGTQIASALDFAHSEGYVHRDVKPENILFDRNNNAILTDFGIAVSGEAKSKMTAAGVVIGTPKYMSPEQAKGVKLDGRSDLYSLGVIIYEMLTGHPPYVAENPIAVCQMHIANPVPKLPTDLSSFQNIIDACMAKDVEDRVKTGKDIVALLTEAEKNNELLAARDETLVRISRDLVQNVEFDGNEKTEVGGSAPTPGSPSQQLTEKIPSAQGRGDKAQDQGREHAATESLSAQSVAQQSSPAPRPQATKTAPGTKSAALLGAAGVLAVAVVAAITYVIMTDGKQTTTEPEVPVTQNEQPSSAQTNSDQATKANEKQPAEETLASNTTSREVNTKNTSSSAGLLKSVSIISPKTQSLCESKEPYLMGKRVIGDQDSLSEGDCFSIQVDTAKTVDLAVYAHSEDGTLLRLLPNECNAMGFDGVNVDAGKQVSFPITPEKEMAVIGLDAKAGREWVFTVATSDPEARQMVMATLVDAPDICTGEGGNMRVADMQEKLKSLSKRLPNRIQWYSNSFIHKANP